MLSLHIDLFLLKAPQGPQGKKEEAEGRDPLVKTLSCQMVSSESMVLSRATYICL